MNQNDLGNVLLDRERNKQPSNGQPFLQPPQAGGAAPFQSGMMPPAWSPPPTQAGAAGMPQVPPSNPARVPPQWKRWETAQHMTQGYQNGWNPNPMLIRILEGSK